MIDRDSPLHLVQLDSNAAALGLAVDHLMDRPAFADLKFGELSRVLVGQINLKHYWFVLNSENRIQGFIGWALATKEKADAWVESRAELRFEDSSAGDCIIFNAWSAVSGTVHRHMVKEMRRQYGNKAALYFKRRYADGRQRGVRLAICAGGRADTTQSG